jgi:hypothetical protein
LSKRLFLALCWVLVFLPLAGRSALAGPAASPLNLHLRRATFDPLREAAPTTIAPSDSTSRLLLVQFDTLPDDRTRATLASAGLRPLLYIPDNALLVRAIRADPPSSWRLPGLRWSGPFLPAYKLPAELDGALDGRVIGMLDLRLLAAPDADMAALERGLGALGGGVLAVREGLNGPAVHVHLPGAALGAVLQRDDVLWVERLLAPAVFNDRASGILGVAPAQRQFGWLKGAGQIVAVTDTGLDVQASVQSNANPDFTAGRIARGFSKNEMLSGCSATDWSDLNGHGTHVAGTVLGSGARSPNGLLFAGMAPEARLVVEAVSSGGAELDCLPFDTSYLAKAYDAGARVQNASWGSPTGISQGGLTYGAYTMDDQAIDDFLWSHKEHLFVVAAGNEGADRSPRDGVIDADSITSPGTAKNVLTVGSSESFRPPVGVCAIDVPENFCYAAFGLSGAPFGEDPISDNVDGMAAFSSRGPADDGRIKPEIVAPGTNIISAASHHPSASYFRIYNADYAYDSGTSMSAPMLSGMAALVRQWLGQERQVTAPSAALVKALLLNGAADITPGQYGVGAQREVPAAWPNNVEGWGRAALTDTVDLDGSGQIWFAEVSPGLVTGATTAYTLTITGSRSLRVTLAWTDYPGFAGAGKTLVNDLDLEVQTPSGATIVGNMAAPLPSDCRDSATLADRCDNVESVELTAPVAGVYTIRVRGAAVPQGPQPFALVARRSAADTTLAAPTLQPIPGGGPALALSWTAVDGASYYVVEVSSLGDFATLRTIYSSAQPAMVVVEDVGDHFFRVRACSAGGCGAPSNVRAATVTIPPQKRFLPLIGLRVLGSAR